MPPTRTTPASLKKEAQGFGFVQGLGLLEYLRARLAVAGTPEDCLAQASAAVEAGARRLMFTVSLVADPVRTVELFGRRVLPALRRGEQP